MMRKSKSKIIEKISTVHKNILHAKLELDKFVFTIILVHLSSSDSVRNNIIQREINTILNKNINQPVILLGDFNGHVGFLGPQEVNMNGEKVLHWITDKNLILLNGDPRCSGEITWENRGFKSSIDFILVNQTMYSKFNHMKIDEEKSQFDLSDHNY